MATIGTDCDLMLQHGAVNGGAAVGFVLEREGKGGGLVTLEREAYYDGFSWSVRLKYRFRIWIGDDILLPNSTKSTRTRAQWYALLQSLLDQRTGLTLTLARGTHANLRASLKYLQEELQTGRYDVLEVALNNGGFGEASSGTAESPYWR